MTEIIPQWFEVTNSYFDTEVLNEEVRKQVSIDFSTLEVNLPEAFANIVMHQIINNPEKLEALADIVNADSPIFFSFWGMPREITRQAIANRLWQMQLIEKTETLQAGKVIHSLVACLSLFSVFLLSWRTQNEELQHQISYLTTSETAWFWKALDAQDILPVEFALPLQILSTTDSHAISLMFAMQRQFNGEKSDLRAAAKQVKLALSTQQQEVQTLQNKVERYKAKMSEQSINIREWQDKYLKLKKFKPIAPDLSQVEKALEAAYAENYSLQASKEQQELLNYEQTEQIQDLVARLNSLQAAIALALTKVENSEEAANDGICESSKLIHFNPSWKLVCVGGSNRQEQKLKEVLPNVVFVSSANTSKQVFHEAKGILVFANFCGHSLFHKFANEANRRNIPVINTQRTNVAQILQELDSAFSSLHVAA